MERLESLRVAIMHGRELLPHERTFAEAISGEIRNRVTIYRTGKGGEDREYFPRIDSVHDSFGNARTDQNASVVDTGLLLHPGDAVTFDVRVWDPDALPFRTAWSTWPASLRGVEDFDASFAWEVKEEDIGLERQVLIWLYSSRNYHRYGGYDDVVEFHYKVLPKG